ncbi:MAG: hypothetical protein CL531_00565 [Aestuariibacter sp.]|nr:hypothetical protein [Aestuariibacter sp.]|tara:strand:- start:2963 stop:4492 length:1530 start_codon:yes stop_codon:yes gene_type:complete
MKAIKQGLLCLGVMFVIACSPIGDVEKVLEVVEKEIASKSYTKQSQRIKNRIVSANDSDLYKSLLASDDMLKREKAVADRVASIHAQARAIRAMEKLENSDANKAKARRAIDELNREIARWRMDLSKWEKRYKFYADLIEKMPEQKKSLMASKAKYDAKSKEVRELIAKAKVDHPHQILRLKEFGANLDRFDSGYKALAAFFDKGVSGVDSEDIEAFAAKYSEMKVESGFPLSLAEDYVRMIGQLYKSYSKVLEGMSEYHAVAVSGVSWDEYYDYPTETTLNFPVTEVSYAMLTQLQRDYGSGREMRLSSARSDSALQKATGNKINNAFPNGDDRVDIWLEDAESEYVHEYMIIEDGEVTLVEENVDRKTYLALKNAEGKEVFSKPYGKFEDQAIDRPQSPGAAFVGNEKYGSWQKDQTTGLDVWQWFLVYSIFDDLTDDAYDRRRHREYMASMGNYIPPARRSNHSWTNSYGVTSMSSPMQSSITKAKNTGVKGAGASYRNRGPGKGK